ncbi:MAG: hypothetical protein HY917_03780 [Candidatus Diapherotrites archaeon]|nr:hypothetical protein [Candidatus Diapherotrites archaeon]
MKEEWQNDGSVVVLFEVPGGLQSNLLNDLNHLTHGSVETRIVENKTKGTG